MPNSSRAGHRLVAFLVPWLLACAMRSGPAEREAEAGVPPSSAPVAERAAAEPVRPPRAPSEIAGGAEAIDPAAPADEDPLEPPRPLPADYLHFPSACDPGDVVTVAAIGDLLIHHELQRQALRTDEGFVALWQGVTDLLSRADITYANLEGPAAWGISRKEELVPDPGRRFDNVVYSGYAKFNYHPSIAADLAASGVDVVSTANNHALDRGPLGIDRTLDALHEAGLATTGTRRQGSDEPLHAITEVDGIRIAWLACTLHTNFGKDEQGQVLHCFRPADAVEERVAALAARPDVDAVIVTPHWGREYEPEPHPKQRELAQRWIDAGATAILGSHSHVLGPWEVVDSVDGRPAFVLYSLGNFASHQRTLNRRSTIVLYLGLRKTAAGEVELVGARYVPLHVRMEGKKERFFVEAVDRVGGPAEARALVVEMYGPHNLLRPDEPLDVAPHCRPGWRTDEAKPAHPEEG